MAGQKPPNLGGYFAIPNWVFDEAMPSLSPCAWKILCVVIRQTLGWRKPGGTGNGDRREWDQLSYSQFRKRSGIASDATIKAAIDECMAAGFLLRREVAKAKGYNRPSYAYSLNWALGGATTLPGVTTTAAVAGSTTGAVDTKRHPKHDDDGYMVDHQKDHAWDAQTSRAVDALIDLHWNAGEAAAHQFVTEHGAELILDICRHAKKQGFRAPWVRKNVSAWKPTGRKAGASAEGREQAERLRYIQGEYADLIMH